MRTGMGNTWDKNRVYSLRHQHRFPNFDPQQPCSKVTLKEAARRLQVSEGSVRQMILEKNLPASQVVEFAPWEIPVEALDSDEIQKIAARIRGRKHPPAEATHGRPTNTVFSYLVRYSRMSLPSAES